MAVNHLGSPDEEPLVQKFIQEAADISSTAADGNAEVKKRFITVAGDVSDPKTGPKFIEEIISAFGRLDIFVSNAGICEFKEFLECVYIPALFYRAPEFSLYNLASIVNKERLKGSHLLYSIKQFPSISMGHFTSRRPLLDKWHSNLDPEAR